MELAAKDKAKGMVYAHDHLQLVTSYAHDHLQIRDTAHPVS